MGIVKILLYSVDAQNFVDDNSSKCDYCILSASEVPDTVVDKLVSVIIFNPSTH